MTISGDERLLQALGFAEIQSAKDTQYEVTIEDAHTGQTEVLKMRFNGYTILNALNNIDVRIGTNFGIRVDGTNTLRDGYGSFVFTGVTDEFFVHIASNTTILQIGANEGELLNISFGDASIKALGIDKITLVSRETASRAITVLDNAIDIVSMRRARLGAYQNRMEHSIANLTASSMNLTHSESRIRDADMAREMLNFTKLNILMQTSTSMLAQANMFPQHVVGLLR
jgi:flagellin